MAKAKKAVPKAPVKGKAAQGRVSAKISHMVKEEGMPQKQAVATALSMERAGRLGPKGGYKRAKAKGKR